MYSGLFYDQKGLLSLTAGDEKAKRILVFKYILPYQQRSLKRSIRLNKLKAIHSRTKKKRIRFKLFFKIQKLINEDDKDFGEMLENGNMFLMNYERDVK